MIISIIFHTMLLLLIFIVIPLRIETQKEIKYVTLTLDITGTIYNPLIEQEKQIPQVQPKKEIKKTEQKKEETQKISKPKKEITTAVSKKAAETIQTPVNETTETSETKEESEDKTGQLIDELISSTPVKKTTVTNRISWEQGKARQVIYRVEPVLPDKYKKLGFNITGIVSFEINKYGHVSYTYITKSTGYVELDTILRETMEKWKFNPVLDDSSAIGSITFVFNFQ